MSKDKPKTRQTKDRNIPNNEKSLNTSFAIIMACLVLILGLLLTNTPNLKLQNEEFQSVIQLNEPRQEYDNTYHTATSTASVDSTVKDTKTPTRSQQVRENSPINTAETSNSKSKQSASLSSRKHNGIKPNEYQDFHETSTTEIDPDSSPGSTDNEMNEDNSVSVTTTTDLNSENKAKDDKNLQKPFNEFQELPRLDGVKVGHVRKMELQPGNIYQVKTRSIHPPIFEIPDFLTDSECKHMIYQATRQGLEASYIRDLEENISIEPTNEGTFNGWDQNRDSGISVQEVLYKLQELSFLYFMEEDIETMFFDLAIDQNGNGVIDLDEFLQVTTGRIMRYLHKLASNHPRTMIRNSRQTWLEYSTVNGLAARQHLFLSYIETQSVYLIIAIFRVAALTKLPVNVIEGSEKIQVVNYGSMGHYYCHHDSEEISENLPCCLANDKRKCILCRYITVLYFLNDVEEGGETAFPVADNVTFSDEAWAKTFKDTCDFSKSCHQANLYIKPRKGTAVMWYNHVRNDSTGWVGDLDHRSYHGGCDVIKGHKWIANNWINIIGQSRDTMILYQTPKEDSIND